MAGQGIKIGGPGGAGAGPSYAGVRNHRLMCPPPGYKFIPRTEKVCGEKGCFECYDIYCERCESKDRRIIELETRTADLVKHLTLLQERLLSKGGQGQGPGGPGAGGRVGEAFAVTQSPTLHDPNLQMNYVANTTFHQVP